MSQRTWDSSTSFGALEHPRAILNGLAVEPVQSDRYQPRIRLEQAAGCMGPGECPEPEESCLTPVATFSVGQIGFWKGIPERGHEV